jgi:iron complex outermembrane receptor protein
MASLREVSIATVATLLASASAAGQEPVAPDDLSAPAALQPVLTPTHMREALRDIPATVTILPGTVLANMGSTSIAEALRLVFGSTLNHLGWTNYDLKVGKKSSTDPSRVTILVDGIEVDDSLLEPAFLSSLPVSIDDVERIEITEGPGTAGYGHALTAAILNIVTRHPDDVERALGRLSVGSYGSSGVFGRIGATMGVTSMRLTLTHRQRGADDDEVLGRARSASLTIDRVMLRTSTRLDDDSQLEVDASYLGGSVGGGSQVPLALQGDVASGYASAVLSHALGRNDALSLRVDHWFNAQDRDAAGCAASALQDGAQPSQAGIAGAPSPPGLSRVAPFQVDASPCQKPDKLDRRTLVEAQDVHVFSEGLRLVGGVGMRQEQARDALPGVPGWAATYSRGYADLSWRAVPSVSASLGGAVDHASSQDYDESIRTGVNWHVTDDQTLRVAASWGRWASDVNPSLGLSGNLVTGERSTSADAGWLADVPAWNAKFSARLFYLHLAASVWNGGTEAMPVERRAFASLYGAEGRGTADLARDLTGYLALSTAFEGSNSGVNPDGVDWIWQTAAGVTADLGHAWRVSGAYFADSGDTAGTQTTGLLALTLIKDFGWLGSRARVTLSGRHLATTRGKGGADSSDVAGSAAYASLQLAY